MELNYKIIVVTPTYNRKSTLPKLYQSLKNQNKKDFVWLIIDDGSSDDTREYVEKISRENEIIINYIYQDNGGKGRALNKAFTFFETASLYVIVDSDDYLLNDAIENVQKYIDKYKDVENIGAFFFHYKTEDGNVIKPTGNIISKDKVMTRYEYNNKYKQNDGCVCYFGRAVKKYKYPEFQGEKYVGPTVIQLLMANEYKMVFSPEVIGVAEYQENGLTQVGRKLRMKNPLGMLFYSGLQQSERASFKTRIKNSIGAQAYRFISNLDRQALINYDLTKYLRGWALFPGLFLKMYWTTKHEKGRIK